jgi:hypothetical protein
MTRQIKEKKKSSSSNQELKTAPKKLRNRKTKLQVGAVLKKKTLFEPTV